MLWVQKIDHVWEVKFESLLTLGPMPASQTRYYRVPLQRSMDEALPNLLEYML